MKTGKELDPYLRARIGEARTQLEQLIKPSNRGGTSRVYYIGNFQKDVLDNFTEKQANKIFKIMDKFKKDVHMFQKKIPSFKDADGVEWSGYEYIAVKK
tara:strand:+ start:50 stop:346 length:297 start_codon:yes stop_codon:yes gene_type:complete